jgi:hypothetical protein
MKNKLYILFLLFSAQIVISQTGMFVHGKVVNNDVPIKGVEVISLNTRNIVITDTNGLFSIIVKPKDVLVFGIKGYEPKRIVLDPSRAENYYVKVVLVPSRDELEEIIVTSFVRPKFDSQKITDTQYFDDLHSSLKNTLIDDGTIEKGINFIRLIKDAKSLVDKD